MKPNVAHLRKDYSLKSLDERDVDPDPLAQFGKWLDEAIRAEALEPTAMNLSTVDARGRPAGRIMLLKGVDDRGFVFFSNYGSRKGRDLAAHPSAALTFLWKELERQVRVEGAIEKVDAAESDAYYEVRPLGSRIGAWASPQSDVVESRLWLESRVEEFSAKFGEHPPRPPHWGGYRVIPDALEFWQGRQSRLHDRIAYRLENGKWARSRLAP
jgi:pyridoxamine 5'-phosphate oxidase